MLTKNGQTTILRRTPIKMRSTVRQKQLKKAALKSRKLPIVKRYQKFFYPIPSLVWRQDEDFSPFEQPSPLKWVPSETTYGIGAQ
jgi:hypothetical protein